MASPKYEVIFLYDATTGAPKTGVNSLVFDSYKNDQGVAIVPQPAIVELPGNDGAYAFLPVFTDLNRGIRYIINTQNPLITPQRSARYMRPEDWNIDMVTSGIAQFYSNGDTVAPLLTSAASPKHTQVNVTFSEAVVMDNSPIGALNLANYEIPGLTLIDIRSLTSKQVAITTSPQAPNFLYTLRVKNVQDLQGNAIA